MKVFSANPIMDFGESEFQWNRVMNNIMSQFDWMMIIQENAWGRERAGRQLILH